MFELNEDKGYGEWHFKAFGEFKEFKDFAENVTEEANYWKGYANYFRDNIRPDKNPDDYQYAMDLVKQATNRRQAIYNDVRLLAGLDDKYRANAPVNKRGVKMLTPEQVAALNKERQKIENRIVLKAFEMAKARQEFIMFLGQIGMVARFKYNKTLNKDDE